MREILFRGKRTSNGKWVEGFYFIQRGNPNAKAEEHYIRCYDTDFSVDPETVGQFTGLTDRNGVKIFEGDIVLHKGECGLVGYSYDYGMFEVDFDYCFASFIDISASNCEVIGNIYDNPELMKVNESE